MDPRIAHLYLYPDLRRRAQSGADLFISTVTKVLRAAHIDVVFHDDSPEDMAKARYRSGYALFRMDAPPHPNSLVFRRTYLPGFYRIETHGRRWDWPVARADFDPSHVIRSKAHRFFGRWRQKLFGDQTAASQGHIFVPLQGHLLRHRSFQHAAPLDMLRDVLTATDQPVIATLHPKERYSTDARNALLQLAADFPRLTVQTGGSTQALLGCDYVATQNSSLALQGYFLRKPAILYAGSDFHHIAVKPAELGVEGAFACISSHAPDYEAYLWWFFRDHAVDVSRPNRIEAVANALRQQGWPV